MNRTFHIQARALLSQLFAAVGDLTNQELEDAITTQRQKVEDEKTAMPSAFEDFERRRRCEDILWLEEGHLQLLLDEQTRRQEA